MIIQSYLNLLNLTFNSSEKEIISAWQNLPKELKSKEHHLVVKALLDPYYHEMLKLYPNINQLLPGGFFDDHLEPGIFDFKENLFCTPVHKILNRFEELKNSHKPFIIMLNTGSYSPIHFGHLQMMELAYEQLSKDYTVLGGYFSPSHDSYVSTKYAGTAAYNSDARIDLCENFVANHPYLSIDPWETRYNDRAINFTNVILRLKKIFHKILNVPIQIAYIFGSDNAGFTWAFLKDDISVCFERPGYELQYETVKNDTNLNTKKHYFINKQNNNYSSKLIREGSYHFLSDKVKSLYFEYKDNKYPIYSHSYLIRDDSFYCSSIFPVNKEQIQCFKNNLELAFKNAFQKYTNMDILFLNIKKQNDFLNSVYFFDKNILNADLWTSHPNQTTLNITRLFYLSDSQISSNQLIPRFQSLPLDEQLKDIHDKNIVFVDDDIASGKTVEMVKQLLPISTKIEEIISLSQQSFYEEFNFEQSYNFHDIVDFRDFLIGSKEGGLTVKLPNNEIGKAPYVWPYVSLSHRAKLPHISQREFSLSIWKANKEFFESFVSPIYIKDTFIGFKKLAYSLGFTDEMTMSEFCQIHIDLIK